MKNFFLILIAITIFSCKSDKPRNEIDYKIPIAGEGNGNVNFDWLLGRWIRVEDDETKTTFEEWERISNNQYKGKGYIIENDQNVWQENMELLNNSGLWRLEVSMSTEIAPTVFKFIEMDSVSFVCENPDNEFPTQIKYFRRGDKLKAIIKGGETVVPFEFVKVRSN